MRRSFLTVWLLLVAGCIDQQPVPTPIRVPVVDSKTSSKTNTKSTLEIGDDFPVLKAIDLDGNAVVFDDSMLGSRYTLVVFWSTWCGFCMQELPHEIELSRRYADRGLRVIGINADKSFKAARAAALENSVPWLNLYEGQLMLISKQLGINGWPALILLDSKGTVVATTLDLRRNIFTVLDNDETRTELALDRMLEELLGEKANP